jgi:hypothetical protein
MLIENIARLRQALLPQSVGRLFVLVLAAGIGLGWVVRSVRSRCDALATIRSAGGSIRYDSNWVNKASAQERLTTLKHLFIDRRHAYFAGLRELERALPRLWISTSRT